MSLSLNNIASLRRIRSNPELLDAQARQPFENARQAAQQFTEAIDSYYPKLDDSEHDGAPDQKGLVRYHTARGERIQVDYSGDSKSGEYVQEWVGGGFLYTKFDQNAIDNYQVGPQGASHLHIDRQDPSKTYVEHTPRGMNILSPGPAPASFQPLQPEQLQEKDGVRIAVLEESASSEKADQGETVLVNYTGWLENGHSFDSSLNRGQPFSFQLGQGRVIQGWERGVEGMAVGEKRQLRIPAELAYGERSVGSIPAGSPLIFEVELLATSGELSAP